MPIFISYSHNDKDFVNKLAAQLVRAKAHVWIDLWELHVGDSLVRRIQEAIEKADALVVVLSTKSVASPWCSKELDAGLVRELEERRVIILPVLLEDCQIPLFLRDKMYADFRKDFQDGLKQVLEAIAGVSSDSMGRDRGPEWSIDWTTDWWEEEDRFNLRLTLVEQEEGQPYTVLSELNIRANPIATGRYRQYAKQGLDFIGRQVLLEMLRQSKRFADLQVLITDNFPQKRSVDGHDPKSGAAIHVDIFCRRLGEDTGRDVILHLGKQVSGIVEHLGHSLRPLTDAEQKRLARILSNAWML
jgi:hypothetical protein